MPDTPSAHARSFLMHRAALLDLLAQIPEEQGEFSAWDGGMSFRALADHLSGSSARLGALVAGTPPQPVPPSASLADALARLQQTTDSTRALLDGLTDDELGRTVEAFGGRKMPVRALVEFLIQHEAHHKGQIWLMARMIGVQPPMFVKF